MSEVTIKKDTMSEDSKSIETNSEKLKSSTTKSDSMSEDRSKSVDTNSEDETSSKTDSGNRDEIAGNDDTKSENSNSSTNEAKSVVEQEIMLFLKNLKITGDDSKDSNSNESEAIKSILEEYPAAFLKNGIMQGFSYQLKILTWTAWSLFKNKDENWKLGAEMYGARGFHDLVVKYDMKTDMKEKEISKYRFMQIKYTSSKYPIEKRHLLSTERFDKQYSLIYLFVAYLDMLRLFNNDQIVDLTVFTNKSIDELSFLILIDKKDSIFNFEKGQRYRINLEAITPESKIMKCLKKIKNDYVCIQNFLNKLVFAVNQPTESELDELIINDIKKEFEYMPEIFYTYLLKNMFDWFLTYNKRSKTSPYYTRGHITNSFATVHRTLREVVQGASKNAILKCLFS